MLGETDVYWSGLQAGMAEGDEARIELCCDVVNAAQDAVDKWIKEGGLAGRNEQRDKCPFCGHENSQSERVDGSQECGSCGRYFNV